MQPIASLANLYFAIKLEANRLAILVSVQGDSFGRVRFPTGGFRLSVAISSLALGAGLASALCSLSAR